MATHTEHRPDDLTAQDEARKDQNAKAFFLIALTMAVIAAIAIGAYFLLRDDSTPPVDPPVDTAAQRAADEAAAIDTVEAQVAAADAAQASGTIEGSGYEQLASPAMVENLQAVIENNARGGYVFIGTTEVASAEVTSYEAVPFQPGQRRIGLDVCIDISRVSETDAAGNPVQNVNPDGTPDTRTRLPVRYFVQTTTDDTYYVESTIPAEDRSATC